MVDSCDLDVPREEILSSGVISGILAGLISGLMLAFQAVYHELSPLYPFQLIARGVFRKHVLGIQAPWVFSGILIHLILSAGLGVLFSKLITCRIPGDKNQTPGDRAFVSGALFGSAIWLVSMFGFLPALNPAFHAYQSQYPGAWFCFHLLFGSVLMITPGIRAWIFKVHSKKSLHYGEAQKTQERKRAA